MRPLCGDTLCSHPTWVRGHGQQRCGLHRGWGMEENTQVRPGDPGCRPPAVPDPGLQSGDTACGAGSPQTILDRPLPHHFSQKALFREVILLLQLKGSVAY